MRYFNFITLAGLLLMSSCYQDIDNSEEILITPVPVPETNTNISGNLVDPNDGSVAEQAYSLVVNGSEYNVASDYFLVEDARVKKQGQLIEAYRDDRLIGLGFYHLIEFDLNKVELVNIEESTQRLTQQDGLWTANLDEVSLIVVGSSLDGVVLHTSSLDRNTTQRAMGSTAFAFDAQGEAQLLSTVPRYGFTIRSSELEASNGFSYELVFEEIEAGQVLLHFDVTSQQWHQVAKLNSKTINISELGYYMVAETNVGVYQEGQVISDGMPISFLRSRMDHLNAYQFYTTEQGRWGAVLPESQDISLEYLSPCDDQISSVGIHVEMGNEEDIINELDLDNQFLFQLSTEVISCGGEVNSAMGIRLNQAQVEHTLLFSAGTTNHQIAICDADFSVAAYNLEEEEVGPSLDWNASLGDDLDFLLGCNSVDGFAYLQIRDDTRVYDDIEVRRDAERTQVIRQDESFWVSFRGSTADQYKADAINIVLDDSGFGANGYNIGCDTSEQGCGITNFYVTHYEENEGWLRISFSGEVFMRTITNLQSGHFPVSGFIQVRL